MLALSVNLKFHLQWNHRQKYRAPKRQGSDDHPGLRSASAVKTSEQLALGLIELHHFMVNERR